jgi:hypothetical protein
MHTHLQKFAKLLQVDAAKPCRGVRVACKIKHSRRLIPHLFSKGRTRYVSCEAVSGEEEAAEVILKLRRRNAAEARLANLIDTAG